MRAAGVAGAGVVALQRGVPSPGCRVIIRWRRSSWRSPCWRWRGCPRWRRCAMSRRGNGAGCWGWTGFRRCGPCGRSCGRLCQAGEKVRAWSSTLAQEWMAAATGERGHALHRRACAGVSRPADRVAPALRGPAAALPAGHHRLLGQRDGRAAVLRGDAGGRSGAAADPGGRRSSPGCWPRCRASPRRPSWRPTGGGRASRWSATGRCIRRSSCSGGGSSTGSRSSPITSSRGSLAGGGVHGCARCGWSTGRRWSCPWPNGGCG